MRHGPVDAAGLYVPGGKAAYPSSVLMNAMPATVAGVGRRVMVVPAPMVSFPIRCWQPRISLAFPNAGPSAGRRRWQHWHGEPKASALLTRSSAPGNAYVATAKRQVFGRVGIDSIAGPSEILILADSGNSPDWLAIDLLSQAEHDEAAQAILITDDAATADAVMDAVEAILPGLERSDVATASWRDHGAVITVDNWQEGADLANRIAAEHLEIATEDPHAIAAMIRHAGAIFLGRWTPEAIGDYVAGPNHVLPTARTARFSSGLGTVDFMKRTTMVECDADALGRIGPAAVTLAGAEGLEAHGLSISRRLNR